MCPNKPKPQLNVMTKFYRKPNFLIIGVQKSATTWLQEHLRKHPKVYMPRNEVHYFDRDENYNKGESWYLEHFIGAGAEQLIGEKTPDYIWTNTFKKPPLSSQKHRRIKNFKADIKLIVILRNPIERFVSAVHHNRRRGRLPIRLEIDDLLTSKAHSNVVKCMMLRGCYATQLKNYLDLFELSQIKIIFHDDIHTDPNAVLEQVFSFLELGPYESTTKEQKRYNDYCATEVGANLLSLSDGWLYDLVIKLDRYILSRLPLTQVTYPKLFRTQQQQLMDYYRAEMLALPKVINKAIPNAWGF